MTNHVHILVTPMVDHGISNMMQALGRRYVYYINKSHHRSGTLWEGRYGIGVREQLFLILECVLSDPSFTLTSDPFNFWADLSSKV